MSTGSTGENERPANTDEINNIISHLLEKVDEKSRPNHISALWHVLKDIEAIKLNIKYFGYDLLSRTAKALPVRENLSPIKINLACKPSTQADIESYWLAVWAGELKLPVVYVRKLWEFAFVLQSIYEHGFLNANSRGLGFGCGIEPIPSYLASKGVKITITDAPPENQVSEGWAKTNQHTSNIEKALYKHLVTDEQFWPNVDFRFVDMNDISGDCRNYDFCWSICALEHLGSIKKGMDFIENSLETLKPNGLSVHTTEFNFLHDDWTIDNWGTVYPQ